MRRIIIFKPNADPQLPEKVMKLAEELTEYAETSGYSYDDFFNAVFTLMTTYLAEIPNKDRKIILNLLKEKSKEAERMIRKEEVGQD